MNDLFAQQLIGNFLEYKRQGLQHFVLDVDLVDYIKGKKVQRGRPWSKCKVVYVPMNIKGGLGNRTCDVFAYRCGFRCSAYHTGGYGPSCEVILRHDTIYSVKSQQVQAFGSKSDKAMELETTS